MKIVFVSAASVAAALAFSVGTATGGRVPPAPKIGARGVSTEALNATVQRYCGSCHSPTTKKGNLSLRGFDVDSATTDLAVSEKVIRKLRAQMMPPPESRKPGGDTLLALVETLEQTIDKASAKPNPGTRTFQRLNRPEYEAAVRDLLGIEIDAGLYLPLDTKSANFDNIADVQALSPTLLESYLNAAAAVSRAAVGDKKAASTLVQYNASPFGSQHPWDHVEGAPFGTRGGIVADHIFPADAQYTFRINVSGGTGTRLEDIDVSIDGERIALLHYERGVGRNLASADAPNGADYLRMDTVRVKAGQHRVSAAFVRRTEGPYEDLIKPHDWSRASNGTASAGTTEPPHVIEVAIAGPFNATGISETPSRKLIFSCHPAANATAAKQRACADEILTRLGTRAYRRPLTAHDRKSLLTFFDSGAVNGGFDEGVRLALQAILSSPYFVFRFETAPAKIAEGQDYRISDVDLASRLSFFLWGTIPDQQLLTLAQQKRLSNKLVLEREVKRMLADPRANALSTRFAAQWLRLQDLEKVHPDAFLFPDFDLQLADAMRQETELLFGDLVKNDKSILDLFTADYTFVNERLAKHYGIPNITGDEFRKVKYADETRRGILGHGSILVQTSLANRTSPVLRGKWVMEVLIGMPPPPPPPGVPDLEETKDAKDGKQLTTRERMEIHRANATCRACHQYMDPMGLALDNFDVTGKLRFRENAMPLDTKGQMYDGTSVSSPAELTAALLKRPIPLMRSFTENLMAYALGRRVEDYDQPAVRTIAKEAEAKSYRLSSFIMGVVNSSAFRSKRAEAVAADAQDKEQP
jgi:cytochrome c553